MAGGKVGSAMSEQPNEGPRLFAERQRMAKLSRIRQLVFGSLDGLLVPLGVISGVAGGTGDSRAVIVAGIAEAFAGALSMGAGEFIAARSEAQVQRTEIDKELQEMRSAPAFELSEMEELLRHEGVAEVDAREITAILAKHPEAYARTMVEKELGIPFVPETVQLAESVTISLSYVAASIVPLISYFFLPLRSAFIGSVGLTLVALVVIGLVKGRLAGMKLVVSVLEVVVVGSVSAAGGYLLGTYLPRVFGY